MRNIQLSLATLGERTFLLRDLTGHSELLAEPANPLALHALMSELVLDPSGKPVDWFSLYTSWKDRLAAALFDREFGNTVHCRSQCSDCGSDYEFDFTLSDILDQQAKEAVKLDLELNDDGFWDLDAKSRVRPPLLHDFARHADPNALRKDLVVKGKVSASRLDALLETAAPLLDLEMNSRCPDCDADQNVSFRMDQYLIESLAAERPFLLREVHLIASRYGWTHDVILALPRRDRRAFAGMIESERSQSLARRAS